MARAVLLGLFFSVFLLPAAHSIEMGSAGAGGDWMSKEAFSCQRISIPQGRGRGELFYRFDPVSTAILPTGFAVGPDGRLWFLEGRLNRVQAFAPDGAFLFCVEGKELAPPASGIVGLAAIWPKVAVILTGDFASRESPAGPGMRILDAATGRQSRRIPLSNEGLGTTGIWKAAFDAGGSVWVFTNRWLRFRSDGTLAAVLDEREGFVDAAGRLYVSDGSLEVIDGDGRTVASLDLPDGRHVSIAGGSLDTLLFGWDKGGEARRGETTVVQDNVLRLFRADLGRQALVEVDRLVLPDTRYSHPDPNLDYVVPEQVLIQDLTFFRDGVFWFVNYSDSQFWIDRCELVR